MRCTASRLTGTGSGGAALEAPAFTSRLACGTSGGLGSQVRVRQTGHSYRAVDMASWWCGERSG